MFVFDPDEIAAIPSPLQAMTEARTKLIVEKLSAGIPVTLTLSERGVIYLTDRKTPSNNVAHLGKVECEPEITPEMIEAGVLRLLKFSPESDLEDEAAREIYLAMWRHRPR